MSDPWDKKTPAETEEDWASVWLGVRRANEGWPVVGPIVAAVRNWKAWAVAVGVFAMINRPDILALAVAIFGGG